MNSPLLLLLASCLSLCGCSRYVNNPVLYIPVKGFEETQRTGASITVGVLPVKDERIEFSSEYGAWACLPFIPFVDNTDDGWRPLLDRYSFPDGNVSGTWQSVVIHELNALGSLRAIPGNYIATDCDILVQPIVVSSKTTERIQGFFIWSCLHFFGFPHTTLNSKWQLAMEYRICKTGDKTRLYGEGESDMWVNDIWYYRGHRNEFVYHGMYEASRNLLAEFRKEIPAILDSARANQQHVSFKVW